MKLDQFKKPEPKYYEKTSVNITKEQRAFLNESGVNISELFRDFLDHVMKTKNKTKGETK